MLLFFHKGFTMITKRKEQKLDGLWGEILTALVSIGVSYGAVKAEIRNLKQKVDKYDADHDLIIRLDTKVDGISETLQEVKTMMENKRSKK